MCGSPYSCTPTIDSGDLIAIIHPSSTSPSTQLGGFFCGRLRLSNSHTGATLSTLTWREGSVSSASDSDSYSNLDSVTPEVLSVRIHKFGQPLSRSPLGAGRGLVAEMNPVLHSFLVPGAGDTTTTSTGGRLNLGVGGDGVVGRMVSIVDSRRRVLGEGVIGWG